jgi:hypothetical protein
MYRLSTFATAIAICLGTTAVLYSRKSVTEPTRNVEASFAADGAFRDGLYLGKLTADQGQPFRPGIGRWSSEQDRAMFTTGFRRGYSEVVANAQAHAEHARPAD